MAPNLSALLFRDKIILKNIANAMNCLFHWK